MGLSCREPCASCGCGGSGCVNATRTGVLWSSVPAGLNEVAAYNEGRLPSEPETTVVGLLDEVAALGVARCDRDALGRGITGVAWPAYRRSRRGRFGRFRCRLSALGGMRVPRRGVAGRGSPMEGYGAPTRSAPQRRISAAMSRRPMVGVVISSVTWSRGTNHEISNSRPSGSLPYRDFDTPWSDEPTRRGGTGRRRWFSGRCA